MRSYRHNVRSVCAKRMSPAPAEVRIGGTRYVCTLPHNHEGQCGNWLFVTQPESAKLEREHRMDCGGVTVVQDESVAAIESTFVNMTFCRRCKANFPLDEFTWEPDGEPLHAPLKTAWAAQVAEREKAAAEEAERNRLREIGALETRLAQLRSQAP